MIISKLPNRLSSLILLAACASMIIGCDSKDNTGQTSAVASKRARDHVVETIPAGMQTVQSKLTASGTIEAGTHVRLYNEVSGKITSLPFYEGDKVSAGTILVSLDDEVIQAELDKATATREQAKVDYDRLKKLRKQLASDDEIARAHTAYDIAVADEKLQQTRLNKTVITAPFEGIITERHYEPGDVVPMHSHILSMIDPGSLRVKIHLAEHWIPLIQTGDPVDIQVDALAALVYRGKIKRVHPTIDASTRKGVVEIAFAPVPAGVQAGQLARVTLKSQPASKLVVPSHALHHDSKGAYVYVIDAENLASKTYVRKGQQFGQTIEIIDGLNVDEAIVVKGFNGLRHGKKVRIRNGSDARVAGSS